jgi:RNA 3'-terminal phosphate cyclase (ATP)
MLEIDGSTGEGGGQVLRTALALSLVTGKPFRITKIRAGRARGGLMRQHLTCVEAACAIGGIVSESPAVGATELTFTPGKVTGGDYRFAVGTAGSTSLVLQTVLAPLLLAPAPSHVVVEGGTHNKHAPPYDFIERVFLPVVGQMGPKLSAKLVKPGFYPAGGGRIDIQIDPVSTLKPIHLRDRGKLMGVEARAIVAGLPEDIAVRELDSVASVLSWPEESRRIEQLPERVGPGNILILQATFENVVEISSGFGQFGVPAQAVGEKAAKRMAGYLDSKAVAGPYLADQLLLPMALAGGGSFTTVKPSQHTRTAADIISMFLGVFISIEEQDGGEHLVTISR